MARSDGKKIFPPWLDGLNALADKVEKLEALVAKLMSVPQSAPKEEKKAAAPKAPAKEITPKKTIKKK